MQINYRKLKQVSIFQFHENSLYFIFLAIENLRSERERLLSATSSSSINSKKPRRRLSSYQQKLTDSPSTTDPQTPIRSLISLEEDW